MCLCNANVPSLSLMQNLLFTVIMASSTILLCCHVIPTSCCYLFLQLKLCRPCLYFSSSELLTWGDFALQGTCGNVWRHLWEGRALLSSSTGIDQRYPAMHRTSPHTKNYPAQMSVLLRLSNPALARTLDYPSRSFNLLLSPTIEH